MTKPQVAAKGEQAMDSNEDGSWRTETTQFLKETSLHGFKYVTDSRASLWRRCVWLLLIVVGFGWTIQVFSQSMIEYLSYKSVISEKKVKADYLDFPALTFCPVNKLKNSSVLENLPELHPQLRLYSTALVSGNFSQVSPELFARLNFYNFWDLYLSNAPTLQDTFVECYAMGQPISCEHYMTTTVWHQGVCFTFNSHLLQHDDVIQMHASGASASVSFILDVDPNEYYFPSGK